MATTGKRPPKVKFLKWKTSKVGRNRRRLHPGFGAVEVDRLPGQLPLRLKDVPLPSFQPLSLSRVTNFPTTPILPSATNPSESFHVPRTRNKNQLMAAILKQPLIICLGANTPFV